MHFGTTSATLLLTMALLTSCALCTIGNERPQQNHDTDAAFIHISMHTDFDPSVHQKNVALSHHVSGAGVF